MKILSHIPLALYYSILSLAVLSPIEINFYSQTFDDDIIALRQNSGCPTNYVCDADNASSFLSFLHIFYTPSSSYIKFANGAPRDECAGVVYPDHAFRKQADITKVYFRVDTVTDDNFRNAGLSKFASVFGIRILGETDVSNRKILHVAMTLAELLDSKRSGKPASDVLIKLMHERHATLAIAKNSKRVDEIFDSLPSAYECVFFLVIESEDEIIPQGALEPDCPYRSESQRNTQSVSYDKCIGLMADFIIQAGYPLTYPPNSELGKLLKKAFVDSKKNGWLDVSKMGGEAYCNNQCQEISFQSWALTSALGVDSCTCREYGIWKLCTPQEMKTADPQLYGALTQDIRKPNGNYWSRGVV